MAIKDEMRTVDLDLVVRHYEKEMISTVCVLSLLRTVAEENDMLAALAAIDVARNYICDVMENADAAPLELIDAGLAEFEATVLAIAGAEQPVAA